MKKGLLLENLRTKALRIWEIKNLRMQHLDSVEEMAAEITGVLLEFALPSDLVLIQKLHGSGRLVHEEIIALLCILGRMDDWIKSREKFLLGFVRP